MLKLKTLLYLIRRYQLLEVTYHRKDKPMIQETAIKEDLVQENYVSNYIVTSIYVSQGILVISCEERRKSCIRD